ncbi:MAG TPA: putative DNA-binding protein [Pseudogracilibacillus sp.]|nr:putative DNA-binding protein [Pseudogracilibacillus sp.]
MLEKTTRLNMLYDFYHQLLTKKQMEYMELYYREDYSLSEIANHNDVSRQAVHDTIKRTEQHLEMYEKKLRLYDKFTSRNEQLERLEKALEDDNFERSQLLQLVQEIRKTE